MILLKNYNNKVHRTIKMKPIDFTSDSHTKYNEDSNEKDPKFKGNAQFIQKVTLKPLMNFKQKPLLKLEILQILILLKVFFN